MANHRVFETHGFQKDLGRFARAGMQRIQTKLLQHVYSQLCGEPHFGLKTNRLRDWDPPTWRYRIGSWRFFYEIDDTKKIVSMTVADYRGSSYYK